MGGGNYSTLAASSRSLHTYSHMSREEKFSQRNLSPDMDPSKFEFRESCDSEEHPESFPIIIALDETGSMGSIPDHLITSLFPGIMDKIMKAGVPNPQVCFVGIGDCEGCREQAPIQCGQFESSDELMEKWLKKIFLEGRGGGNGGESYNLAWYFAAKRTKIDSFSKRNKKGCLITIGDEPCLSYIERDSIRTYFGDSVESDIPTSDILKEAQKEWDIYHIHCEGSHTYRVDETNWKDLLGEHLYLSNNRNADDLLDLIPAIVNRSYHDGPKLKAGD